MTATINTTTLSDFTRLADFEFEKNLESVDQNARNSGLFRVRPFPANTGDTFETNEIDLEEYSAIKDEGNQAEQAKYQQGYSKVGTLTRYGTDIGVTWEMRNRNKYETVLDRITNLGKQQAQQMDLDLSHRLTFGTATSYTDASGRTVDTSVGDTLALFSTVHTVKGSASTFRNRLANNPQFSKGALENMEKMVVENTINQFGQKMAINHDVIWTTDDPNTINTVRETLQSTAAISAPNAGVVNVYQAKYRHVILPRVPTDATGNVDSTKSKYWGIAASGSTTAHLRVEQEPTLNSPSMTDNAADVSTEDWTYTGRTSYLIVIAGGNWITVSTGNGDA